jgi:membrane-associated phospholipid phosphatase
VLARRIRSWWPLLPVVAAYALTYLTFGVLKLWLDRAAPHAPIPHPERLFSGGLSYPGGHMSNTIVWYGVIVLLLSALLPDGLPPRWRLVLRVVPAVTVGLATVYLGYHWVTDNVAAIPLALVIDRIIRRIPWRLGR